MDELKEVTEKIYELLKGSELKITEHLTISIRGKSIREAEILMVLGGSFTMDGNGYIAVPFSREDIQWILGKTLSEQSKETIDFLHQILVR